jgi:predicted phosphodiesterase
MGVRREEAVRAEVLAQQEASASDRARSAVLALEIGRLKKQVRDLTATVDTLERVAEYSGRALKPPSWLTRKPKKHNAPATLVSILSDCHFDERVDPSELDGRNAYSRDIAELRLERYFTQVVRLARDHLAGMRYDGVVLMLAGDLISGDIHEELQDTNEAQTLDTVLHWSDRIAAGVGALAEEFGRVHVPVVVGNHGRRSRKPRAKGRARDNYDWLIGQLLARHFNSDERVTFDIPDGTDTLVKIHDTNLLLTHGDQVSGGGGIGGHWPPLMRLIAKKRNRYDFDALCCGHWHIQIMSAGQGLIVNGTTKGEDEYSSVMGFKSESPQQALFTVAPEHGVTFSAPVLVSAGRKAEGW